MGVAKRGVTAETVPYEKGQIWECYNDQLHDKPFLVRLLRPYGASVWDAEGETRMWHSVVLGIDDPVGNSSGWVMAEWFMRGPMTEMGVLAWAAERP